MEHGRTAPSHRGGIWHSVAPIAMAVALGPGVLAPSTMPAATGGPAITVSPTRAKPLQQVVLTGTGFTRGQVVGADAPGGSAGLHQPFVWWKGVLTALDAGSAGGTARAVSPNGLVVGGEGQYSPAGAFACDFDFSTRVCTGGLEHLGTLGG